MLASSTAVTLAGARASAVRPKEDLQVKILPPFELQGTSESLASLGTEISGYSIVPVGGSIFGVWLRGEDGQARLVSVDQRDALPMFEVFTLNIASPKEIEERLQGWQAPSIPEDAPALLRTIMTTRPTAPVAPSVLDRWPFPVLRTEVLRRTEFIIEDVQAGRTFGNNPNMQSAVRPGDVPKDASATCEVAAGLLFTGQGDRRLLMGVDWSPLHMIVTEVASEIEQYLNSCEIIELSAYLEHLPNLPNR